MDQITRPNAALTPTQKRMLAEINSTPHISYTATDWATAECKIAWTTDNIDRRVYAVIDLAAAGLITECSGGEYHALGECEWCN